ncbi:MAG: cobyrinate a,c-diamide synthase [Nocardioidaceae bacterium]
MAAPASGAGKTTVATGLMAALRARGERVAGFKVGPDYIDPGYHALATGRPGRNLDPVLVGERRIAPLFAHGSARAGVSVVEGVLGLFDGRSGTDGFGSTAHVAGLLDALVLLVVDARGQGSSIAALLHGFTTYRPGVRIAGVVLNGVGSERHARVLTEAAETVGVPVLGAIPRDVDLGLPSRHLGLVTAGEHARAAHTVAAMGEAVAASVDLDAVVGVASAAPSRIVAPWDPGSEVDGTVGSPVIALAAGPAFGFDYPEHAELLRAAGAEVAPFDPLRDERLPGGTAGVVLPGGFPETHGEELSANEPLRARVAALARAGRPVHAECGGLLYLSRELDGRPMCGVLDMTARMSGTLSLGYRDAVAATGSARYAAAERVTAHEFHRTQASARCGAGPAWHWRGAGGEPVSEGFVHGSVHASYLHTHPAGCPSSVRRFVAGCAR